MGSCCPNHINFQLKKYSRVISHDNNLWFQMWQRNLMNFHWTTKNSENFFSMGSFWLTHTRFRLQKCRGVTFHETEHWFEVWINPELSKMAWGLGWTLIRAFKSLKNCTLIGFFSPEYIIFQLEHFIGIMSHGTEGWCKIWKKTDSWLENWHKKLS